MAYQVLARKWRPQRFDDVVGQRGVTQTLRNAIERRRIAQAFVFAGPRGVGKTTTARILARALNCVGGPTAEPCAACEACVEIAEGRDIDVLEIDAATHTQVDTIREVIIAGLAMAPVRDRYKVFIIDEVHQLSTSSFNALLKSIEEPPPHVVFMMATTELGKIPETILSRSQVFEFRTIATRSIVDQLRQIAGAENLAVEEAALALIARAAEGSMRDAQSALDQVIAFAGETITVDDVSAVLGLVSRDLLFDIMEAVAREDAPALFRLAGRAVEAGHDLRALCRELSRLTHDALVVSFDPGRLDDPDFVLEADRGRLQGLAGSFSREDLLRAFDLLMAAEAEIRTSPEPRYSLEMALVRWVHLRKLVPLEDLIASLEKGAGSLGGADRRPATADRPAFQGGAPPARASADRKDAPAHAPQPASRPAAEARPARAKGAAPSNDVPVAAGSPPAAEDEPAAAATADLKDALLAEIRRAKRYLYGTVVAQAHRIQVAGDTISFAFAPAHKALRSQLDQMVPWLEEVSGRLAGRKIKVQTVEATGVRPPTSAEPAEGGGAAADEKKAALREQAMKNEGVQAMLEVFSAEIRDVEEI